MLEIYCGDGKGKTTAAAGLAIRAAGYGLPVLFVQFLKDGSSGEIRILRELPQVTVLRPDRFFGFSFRMSEEERTEMKASCGRLAEDIRKWVNERMDGLCSAPEDADIPAAEIDGVMIFDEIFHAVREGFVNEEDLLGMIDGIPETFEVVMTGRDPSERILERADYISDIHCVRHPYEKGISARRGIEW